MKNNKGFTLVEILSVIVLIALLLGLGVPGVMRISQNMKKRSLNTKIGLVEQAAVLYGQDNKTLLQSDSDCETPDGKFSCRKISIKDLIEDDYLDSETYEELKYTNPVDDSSMLDKCVYVYKKNNRVYAYYSKNDCPPPTEKDPAPVVNVPTLASKNNWYKSSKIPKEEITEINFVDSYIISENEDDAWNAADDGSANIKCFINGTILTIVGNGSGSILANRDSSYFLNGFSKLQKINGLKMLNTSNVENMSNMFSFSYTLTKLDLSGFNTSNVTDMSNMFKICNHLKELDLSSFNTAKVTDMSGMFSHLFYITELDLSGFNTSNVTNMSNMFSFSHALRELDLSSFNTAKVTDMSSMFNHCYALTKLDLNNFNTSKVTNMNSMFMNCYVLKKLDLSKFNTSIVTDMSSMFYECRELTTIYVSANFQTDKVRKSSNMFLNCKKLVGGNGTRFINEKIEYARIDTTSTPGYFTAK